MRSKYLIAGIILILIGIALNWMTIWIAQSIPNPLPPNDIPHSQPVIHGSLWLFFFIPLGLSLVGYSLLEKHSMKSKI